MTKYYLRMAGVKKARPEQGRRGKLIVIDGNDGSGKTTQLELLVKKLGKMNIKSSTFDFPQYNTFFGKAVGRFQMGEFGDPVKTSSYLTTFLYAMDRMMVAPSIKNDLDKGVTVITNRYVTSNFAHQSGKLPKNQRKKFVDWNYEFEYNNNKMPKEDIVIYLFVPHKIAIKLMKNKDRRQREYTNKKLKDLVEDSNEYLTSSEEAYLQLIKRFKHWVKINCVDKKGKMLSRDEIHDKIFAELNKRKLI